MNKISILTLSFFLSLSLSICGVFGATATPISANEVAKALEKAVPGQRIVVKNGTYSDLELKWGGKGKSGKPIVIEPETMGGVVFTGESVLKLYGEWVHVRGFHFKDGTAGSNPTVIAYRLGSEVANNCRISECVIENYNPSSRVQKDSYVIMYGRNNQFDHNSLLDKYNLGVTLIVMLNEEQSRQNHHKINNNYFGPRPVYGSNGAETMRVGTSHQADDSSFTVIENNFFEECNGEVEVVSIKSSDNYIRNNVFYECQGVLALRHGDRSIASDNIFIGNDVSNTGGVRIVNTSHKVLNNKFYNLQGRRFFAPLSLMNAVPNSLPNRYVHVTDVLVKDNYFIDCAPIEFGTGQDAERTLPPDRIDFENNYILNKETTLPFYAVDNVSGFNFKNNKINIARDVDIAGFSNEPFVAPEKPGKEALLKDKGASWYLYAKADKSESNLEKGETILVKAGDDIPAIVEGASANSVVILTTSGGDYTIDRPIVINSKFTIKAADDLKQKPIMRYTGDSSGNIITLSDGADFFISGIAFDGVIADGKSEAYSFISSDDVMLKPYNLEVDNCEFSNVGNSRFFSIRGLKDTFAENLIIKNSLFRGLAGDAINFADEKDDRGRYNAENVLIENCSFTRLLGLGINIYRGGSDESTAGPYVTINNCSFVDVCNKERGSAMRLIGPQIMNIANCNFDNSGRGGAAIRLDETSWEEISISNCNFWNSGSIVTMTNKVVKGDIFNVEPFYVDAELFNFEIVDENPLKAYSIGVK